MKLTEMISFEEILTRACFAARAASNTQDERLVAEGHHGFDCGFGWVVVRPATHPFVRWCKKELKSLQSPNDRGSLKYGAKHYGGGWCFWDPGRNPSQSISVKEAGARAFRDTLAEYNIVAEVGSRLD